MVRYRQAKSGLHRVPARRLETPLRAHSGLFFSALYEREEALSCWKVFDHFCWWQIISLLKNSGTQRRNYRAYVPQIMTTAWLLGMRAGIGISGQRSLYRHSIAVRWRERRKCVGSGSKRQRRKLAS